jgi:hypothetical protein
VKELKISLSDKCNSWSLAVEPFQDITIDLSNLATRFPLNPVVNFTHLTSLSLKELPSLSAYHVETHLQKTVKEAERSVAC